MDALRAERVAVQTMGSAVGKARWSTIHSTQMAGHHEGRRTTPELMAPVLPVGIKSPIASSAQSARDGNPKSSMVRVVTVGGGGSKSQMAGVSAPGHGSPRGPIVAGMAIGMGTAVDQAVTLKTGHSTATGTIPALVSHFP